MSVFKIQVLIFQKKQNRVFKGVQKSAFGKIGILPGTFSQTLNLDKFHLTR